MTELEELARVAVDCGLSIHRELGPGLLETVYEALLEAELHSRGVFVERQEPIDIRYKGMLLRVNFGAPPFGEGLKRIVNNHAELAGSPLRVNRIQAQ